MAEIPTLPPLKAASPRPFSRLPSSLTAPDPTLVGLPSDTFKKNKITSNIAFVLVRKMCIVVAVLPVEPIMLKKRAEELPKGNELKPTSGNRSKLILNDALCTR